MHATPVRFAGRGREIMIGGLTLGLKDALGLALALCGMTASVFGHYVILAQPTGVLVTAGQTINQAVLIVTGVGCFFASLTIAVTNIKAFKAQHLDVQANTASIAVMATTIDEVRAELGRERDSFARERAALAAENRRLADQAADASRRSDRAHKLAHRIAQDADAKVKELEQQIATLRGIASDTAREVKSQQSDTAAKFLRLELSVDPNKPASGPVPVVVVDDLTRRGEDAEGG